LWWIEAAALMAAGDHDGALAQLDQLLAVDLSVLPEQGPAYDARIFGEFAQEARGGCLFHLGRYEEAADAYAEAMRGDPANLAYRSKWTVAAGRGRGTAGGTLDPAPRSDAAAAELP